MRATAPLCLFAVLACSCAAPVDSCKKSDASHAAVYQDLIEDEFVSVYVDQGKALIFSNREGTDVSPNAQLIDLIESDGAIWFVGMAIPSNKGQTSWTRGPDNCQRSDTVGTSSRYSCQGHRNTRTQYDLDTDRGLTEAKVYDQENELVSHLTLFSKVGAFAGRCEVD